MNAHEANVWAERLAREEKALEKDASDLRMQVKKLLLSWLKLLTPRKITSVTTQQPVCLVT